MNHKPLVRFLQILLVSLSALSGAVAQSLTPQTIAFLPINDRPITSAPFYVNAVASSNLPVTLTVQGPATIDDRRLLTVTGVGLVTLTATQPGNTQFSPVTAQLSFRSTQSVPTLAWQPQAITYGMPLSAANLNATATAVPLIDPNADAATVSMQLDTSQIAPGAPISYPQSSSVFRYEGSTMAPTTDPNGGSGYVPVGSAPPLGITFRVAFTCTCRQFEFVVQSRGSSYRIWVDGHYTTTDALVPTADYPHENFVRVQFPDKRTRQIKLSIAGAPPFFGVNTTNGDSLSVAQVPVGPRVIVFGDSWTAPTILQAALPPAQTGLDGSGYGEYLGEYFNWDYWVSGVGGEGFTNPGTDANGHAFPQRVLTDVCPFSPAGVLVFGGTNDASATQTADQQGITATLSNLQGCLPGVPLLLYGPQFAAAPLEAAFASSVGSFSGIHYVDVGQQAWFYGSSTATDTGNEYLFFNGHPTPLGHNFLAEKMASDIVTTYPGMLPPAYSLLAPQPAAGTITYSYPASALLPAGSNLVTAGFSPADPANYSAATLAAQINVSQASSAVTLQAASATQSIVAIVAPQIAGVPTGSVTVSEGQTLLASLPLNAGAATYSTAPLGSGSHTLTFTYSGDGNFTASTNSVVVQGSSCQRVDYSAGITPGAITLNGGATIGSNLLQLTDGGIAESRSAFFTAPLPISAFTTDFTFQLLNPIGDGFTFTIQGNGPQALGGGGGGLGYQQMPNSVAIKFDLYDNQGEGPNSTGIYYNGAAPTVPALDLTPYGLDLHSGHVFQFHLVYTNPVLTGTLTDKTTGASGTASVSIPLSVPAGASAYFGFTGGSGGGTATQNILSWSYSGGSGCPAN